MTSGIGLIVIRNGAAFDMSNLVHSVRWSGRKGSPARSLAVTFIDDDGFRRVRSEINVENGHQCLFSWNGQELFRGMFMVQEQSGRKLMTARAYDNGIYLANNKDTFNFTGTTASDIFRTCCNRFGIPMGEVANTEYRIPELPKPRATAWDVISNALSLTFEATGIRYFPRCVGDNMHLIERRQHIRQWVIEPGVNLEDYTRKISIERVKTRIKLLSREGDILARAQNDALEKRIGVFQDVQLINDEMNPAQLNELVNAALAENNAATQSLQLSALGQTDVISGTGVFAIVNALDISRTFYVEEDVHTFTEWHHDMRVRIVPAIDVVRPQPQQQAQGEIGIGDIVEFLGGHHFVSSVATNPANATPRRAGPARCNLIARGARHPYHLIGGAFINVDGNSNVYGWVDASTVRKR